METAFSQLKNLPARFHPDVVKNAEFNLTGFFLPASQDDDKDYRSWARENFNPDMELNSTWHPVVIDECCKIIKEFNKD